MCGGHRAYRILGTLIDDTVSQHSHPGIQEGYRPDSRAEIVQEVKLRYARGDIDSETYRRMMEMARSGELNRDDLHQMDKTTSGAVSQPPRQPRKRDTEIVSSLNQLYSHRKKLEDARQDTEKVLQNLEEEAKRLAQQAETAETKARQAIGNEEASRAYLETRQKALDRSASVQKRIEQLHENLHRIQNLEADLSTRENELKALESGEQLADLEVKIREDLLSDE